MEQLDVFPLSEGSWAKKFLLCNLIHITDVYLVNSLQFNGKVVAKLVEREENILKDTLFLLQIVPYSDTNEAIWEYFYITAIFMYKLKYGEMEEPHFRQRGFSI